MMIIIVILDQKQIFNIHIIKQDPQKFNPSTNIYKFLIILDTGTVIALLRYSLTSQSLFCSLFNHKPPLEKPEPDVIHDQNREKFIAVSFHHFPL